MLAYAFTEGLCPTRANHGDVGVGGIERLADLTAEIEPAVQKDVRQCEALAAQIVLAGDLAVEPLQAVASPN